MTIFIVNSKYRTIFFTKKEQGKEKTEVEKYLNRCLSPFLNHCLVKQMVKKRNLG